MIGDELVDFCGTVFEYFVTNDGDAGEELRIRGYALPLVGEREGDLQLVVLRGGHGYERLWEDRDLGWILLQERGDLGGLGLKLHVTVGDTVLLEEIVQYVLRGCALAGGKYGLAGEVLHGLDVLIAGHAVEHAEGVDVDGADAVVRLVICDRGYVRREQGDVELAGNELTHDDVRLALHLEAVAALRTALDLTHEIYEAHGGRALQGADTQHLVRSLSDGQHFCRTGLFGLFCGSGCFCCGFRRLLCFRSRRLLSSSTRLLAVCIGLSCSCGRRLRGGGCATAGEHRCREYSGEHPIPIFHFFHHRPPDQHE